MSKPKSPSNKTINQLNQEKLELIFGSVMEVDQIWRTFKQHSFNFLDTVVELQSLHPNIKIDMSILQPPSPPSTPIETDIDQKKKSRTSEDVFNRILWDPLMDKKDFIIGYEDRFIGIVESPFEIFKTGDVSHDDYVPWHRVQYFKRNGELVWDRKSRLDDIFFPISKDQES